MTVTWRGRGHKDAGDSHMTGGCGTCWVWSRVTSEAAIFLAAFASICRVDTGLLLTDGKALYMSPQTVLHAFTGLTLLSTPSCVHLPRRPPLSAGPNPNPRRPPLSAGPNPRRPPLSAGPNPNPRRPPLSAGPNPCRPPLSAGPNPRRPPLSAGPNPRRPPLSAGPNPNPHRPPAVTCSDTFYYSIAVHLLVLTCSDDVTQSSVLV